MQKPAQRRITLGELPQPFIVRPVRVDGIEKYDVDNAYPSRMERIIDGSVTARASARMLSRFLIGQGFEDTALNTLVIGKDRYERPITALKLLKNIALATAYFAGYYIRAQFDGNMAVTALQFEDFKNCRFGLKDSQDYSGFVVVYDNWDKSKSTKIERKKFIHVNVWNMDEGVIKSQVEKAGSVSSYKGQMYFNFLDEYYIYPLSPIDPVQYDADTEDQIGKFKNGELRRGFFMKKIIHHSEFQNQKDADDFKEKMLKFQGGGHQLSFMVLEGTFDEDGNLREGENIKIEDIAQNIDDKMFLTYEKTSINNIRKAYHAIPQILIDYEDGKLGTTSGEALFQAANFYNQMTKELRSSIEQSFQELFTRWVDPNYQGLNWKILELSLGKESTSEITNVSLERK